MKLGWFFGGTLPHFLAGLLSALSAVVSAALPIVGFLLFLAYEGDQEKVVGDALFQEMREYGCGFFAAVLLMLVMRCL